MHIVLIRLNIDNEIHKDEHNPKELFKAEESRLDAILLNNEEMITETKIREKEFKTFGKLASNEFISEFKNVP